MKYKRKPKAKEFFLTVEECDSWASLSLEERALLLRPQIHSIFLFEQRRYEYVTKHFLMFKSFFLGNSASNYIQMEFFHLETQKVQTLVGIPASNQLSYPQTYEIFLFQDLRNILCVPEYSP